MPEKKSPISEARKRANKKWNDENINSKYDHIHLALPAGYKEKLREAVGPDGSINDFIKKAIDQRLDNGSALE